MSYQRLLNAPATALQTWRRSGPALLFAAMLAACSVTPDAERSDLRDPFENTNRNIFAFNMGVDSYVLEPVAIGYKSTVPGIGRRAIDNHLEWASMPSTALNSTLQGEDRKSVV